MNIYAEGGVAMIAAYGITNLLKKYVKKGWLPVIPLILTPLIGVVYAWMMHDNILDAVQLGVIAGGGAMVARDLRRHTFGGKE